MRAIRESRKDQKAEYDRLRRQEKADELRQQKRDYYAKNKEVLIQRSYERYHANAESILEKQRRDYYANLQESRRKARESSKRDREKNPEKVAARRKRWKSKNIDKVRAKAHRRRAKIKGAGGYHTEQDITRIYDKQDGKCLYCGCDLNGSYHLDHFIPIAHSGWNDPDNLVCACAKCNLNKGAKSPYSWPKWNGALPVEWKGRLL
jgi:5-methylcytosine-specific restriction endonuclease McrA